MSKNGHGPPTLYEKMKAHKQDMKGIQEGSVWKAFKDQYTMEQSGMGQDIYAFQKHQKEAFGVVMDSFEALREDPMFERRFVLRLYEIDIETGKDPMKGKELGLTERLLYYWANPWKAAEEILGTQQLSKCNPQSPFTGFIKKQKYLLRDLMDPSVLKLGLTAGRGCAKTFIMGLDGWISQYLIPSCEYMVVSGSDKQSKAAYKFFRLLMAGSTLEQIVEGEMKKSRTDTVSGGYFESFPSSLTAVQSQRTNKVICDEACEMTEDVMDYAYGTLSGRRYTKWVECGTPNYMLHRFYEHYQEYLTQLELTLDEQANLPPGRRWRWYNISQYECDWVSSWYTQSYIDTYGINSHQYKIMVLGQFAPAGGTVFNMDKLEASLITELPSKVNVEYKDDKEVLRTREEDAEFGLYSVGFDCGYTDAHPTALIKAGEDQCSHIYITDEMRPIRTTDIITQSLKSFALKDMATIYSDSGAVATGINRYMPGMIGQFGLDFKVISFQKFKMDMITNCMGMFEQGILHIVKNKCPKLIKELEKYAWDEGAPIDKPKKGGDDHVDAFLLACWGHRNALLDRAYRPEGSDEPMNLDDHLEPIGEGDANNSMDMWTNIYR